MFNQHNEPTMNMNYCLRYHDISYLEKVTLQQAIIFTRFQEERNIFIFFVLTQCLKVINYAVSKVII